MKTLYTDAPEAPRPLGTAGWKARTPHTTVKGPVIDTSDWHHRGATDAQDIAIVLALAVDTARQGRPLGEVHLRLGVALFGNVVKLRALRRCWDAVMDALSIEHPLFVQVRVSDRVLSPLDPHVNLLRNTVVVVSGALGGADAIVSEVEPALGDIGPRVAENTQRVLEMESHLGLFRDPTGGSYAVESLTDDLAQEAWALFQRIEGEGWAWLEDAVAAADSRRASAIADRSIPVLGTTVFPNLDEPHRPSHGNAAPAFSALRSAGVEVVSLRCHGALAEHNATTMWVKNLLAVGGLRGVEDADSAVVIDCSKEGARWGDRAIERGVDALALLTELRGAL